LSTLSPCHAVDGEVQFLLDAHAGGQFAGYGRRLGIDKIAGFGNRKVDYRNR